MTIKKSDPRKDTTSYYLMRYRHRAQRKYSNVRMGVRYLLRSKRKKRSWEKAPGVRKLHNWMRNNYIGSHGLWLKRQHEISPPDYEWRIDGRGHDYKSNSIDRQYLLDRYTEQRARDNNVVF